MPFSLLDGTGSPEGVVTAVVGALYLQTDGPNGQTLWRKISGTGNTGWRLTGSDPGLANVLDYGAKGDGTTDDTSAFQATADSGLSVYVPKPSVAYKLVGTVTLKGNNRGWRQHPEAEIRDFNTTASCLKFAGVTAQMTGLFINGLRVSNWFNVHRKPSVQFGDSNGLSAFFITDVFYDGRSQKGDGLNFDNSYNGKVDGALLTAGSGGVMIVMHTNATNTGNIEFANITCVNAQVGFILNDYRASTNLLNNVHFNNCKNVRDTSPANPFVTGTIAVAASAGSTTVSVFAGTGGNYPAGDWVVIDSQVGGNALWVDKIQSQSGDVLTLSAVGGLPFSVQVGDFIVNSKWGFVLGQSVRNWVMTVPHFERVSGLIGHGIINGRVTHPSIGVSVLRVAVLLRSCQNITIDHPFGGSLSGTNVVVLHQYSDANNGRNAVKGSSALSAMSPFPTMTQVDGGALVFDDERFGGQQTLLGVWHQDTTVAANQTNVQLTGPTGAVRSLRAPSSGVVTKLVVSLSTSRTAGTLTVTVYKSGMPTAFSAVINALSPLSTVTEQFFASGAVAVTKADSLDVRVTTDGAWAPTANNLDVQIWGEF